MCILFKGQMSTKEKKKEAEKDVLNMIFEHCFDANTHTKKQIYRWNKIHTTKIAYWSLHTLK